VAEEIEQTRSATCPSQGLLLVKVDVLVVAEAAILRGLAEINAVLEVKGAGAALPGVGRFEAVVDVDFHLHRRRVERCLVVEPLVGGAWWAGSAWGRRQGAVGWAVSVGHDGMVAGAGGVRWVSLPAGRTGGVACDLFAGAVSPLAALDVAARRLVGRAPVTCL